MQHKLRVAFFAEILTPELDGAVRTMYQLINRIDSGRYEFLFIYGEGPVNIRSFKSVRVPAITVPINAGYSLALPVFAQARLSQELERFKPEVVHIATPSILGEFGLNYAKQHGLPIITIYHTHFISYIAHYFKHLPFLIDGARQYLIQRYNSFYNSCDLIYVPSENIKAELQAVDIEPERMQIWKRGIDSRLFSPAKKDVNAISKLTGNHHPTILFASRLVWEKNLETLFEIYDEIQEGEPKVNFLIVGDGVAHKACKARMKNAIFTGKLRHSKLAALYASADVFLFPSVSETCGNVVLEAMASGLPCVIGNGGGSRDFIRNGENGFVCEPFSALEYVGKIRQILYDDKLKASIVEQGLLDSRTYDWGELASRYFADLNMLHQQQSLIAV
ncbi:glycosyltransferase family 1 protein [Mucilaginibacter terrenus]|uniref:Glycosyltransferase family 1 protein n=1 Tax=Mucilaginibacter terrenus TaxID=2482727 RepID=A0A3E2NQ85_9SPHI|nr:glycosyltransferase family 1 protein [Mucilaginibacter terrenus]RFZ83166.1 glycosyltransferase family 1 protein [Mucilaginibacter terrenus]